LLRPGEPAVRNSVGKRSQSQKDQRRDQPAFPPTRFAPPGLSSRVVVVSITCTFDAIFRHFCLTFFLRFKTIREQTALALTGRSFSRANERVRAQRMYAFITKTKPQRVGYNAGRQHELDLLHLWHELRSLMR
jgi:hypothetical protein